MARLFLALQPDEPARRALAGLASLVAIRSAGRAVPVANLHLTLVFLGEVDAARIGALARAVPAVAGSGFVLALDRIGGFRRAGVAWAGCRRTPPELTALQEALSKTIRGAGFSVDEREFTPHLTLARHIHGTVEAVDIEPISWCARSISLLESARGTARYITLAQWPLADET